MFDALDTKGTPDASYLLSGLSGKRTVAPSLSYNTWLRGRWEEGDVPLKLVEENV